VHRIDEMEKKKTAFDGIRQFVCFISETREIFVLNVELRQA
jgi:hypothetical protein